MLRAVDGSQHALSAVETAKGTVTVVEPSRAERTIVRRVAEARATVPDLELGAVADVSWLAEGAQGRLPTEILVRACALALREFPRANGAYRDGRFELYSRVNVAVVMPAADGYVAATLFDADRRETGELAAELERLAARALAGELTPPEVAGSTFTVQNLGAPRVSRGAVVPVPPQAAALAAGAAQPAAVVRDGGLAAGRRVELTLACDHRILYGEPAAGFLDRVAALLEDPEGL